MRLFTLVLLTLTLSIVSFTGAKAEDKPVKLEANGPLVTIPDSAITLQLGKDTNGLHATINRDVMTIKMASLSPQSGFTIKGLNADQFAVGFFVSGGAGMIALPPSGAGDKVFTYLPPASAATGGEFMLTLPGQTGGFQKKKKGFLN